MRRVTKATETIEELNEKLDQKLEDSGALADFRRMQRKLAPYVLPPVPVTRRSKRAWCCPDIANGYPETHSQA